MNVTDATLAVQQRGFDYLSPGRVLIMLNAAKDAFEDVWEWPWLQTFASGTTPLMIQDLKLVTSVRHGNNELLGLDERQVMQGTVDLAQRGAPEYWWLQNATPPPTQPPPGIDGVIVHAWPGDGADLTVYYVAETPELVNGIDTPFIPRRYHAMWVDLAVCEAYKDSDNFAGAQALRADVMMRMQDVILRYETRNRQHSPFMAVRSFNGDD